MNAILSIELLESRIAPAAIVSYVDGDGDMVTIKTSKGTVAQLTPLLTFSDLGSGRSHLDRVDFALDPFHFSGTDLTITAEAAGGGDGKVDVGVVNALAAGDAWIDLGKITIDGPLKNIFAGDTNLLTPGVKSLTVDSLGVTTAGASLIIGKAPVVKITGALIGALSVEGDLGVATIGTLQGSANPFTGFLTIRGNVGSLTIDGVIGGAGFKSGRIEIGLFSSGLPAAEAKLSKVQKILINGDVTAAAATGGTGFSGSIDIYGTVGSLEVTGSLIGGAGAENNGTVRIFGANPKGVGKLAFGAITAGTAIDSGSVLVQDCGVGQFSVVGSITGVPGTPSQFGQISVNGPVKSIFVGQFLFGSGDGPDGRIFAGAVGTVDIGGIQGSGGFVVASIKKFKARGDITGTEAHRAQILTSGNMGSLEFKSAVSFADIIAGSPVQGFFQDPDVSIGAVLVEGDWTGSNLVAGGTPGVDGKFGTADDKVAPTNSIERYNILTPFIVSAIKSLTINGSVAATASGTDHFGVVAQLIGSVKIGITTLALEAGPSNDRSGVATVANDFQARELALF